MKDIVEVAKINKYALYFISNDKNLELIRDQ